MAIRFATVRAAKRRGKPAPAADPSEHSGPVRELLDPDLFEGDSSAPTAELEGGVLELEDAAEFIGDAADSGASQ